jgi:hypothetical protein
MELTATPEERRAATLAVVLEPLDDIEAES